MLTSTLRGTPRGVCDGKWGGGYPVPYILTHPILNNEGFEGWWNPVEKVLGQIDFGGGRCVFIAHTLPWDGAPGGRADTILRYTDKKDRNLNVKTLPRGYVE